MVDRVSPDPQAMSTSEIFLVAMAIIFALPFLIWRLGRTEYYAPLVVVQIITGILLGPGVLGKVFPEYYQIVFSPGVIQSLNGIAWWAVMLFVMIAGEELDLKEAWAHRRESLLTAGLALGMPLALGCLAAVLMLFGQGWLGPKGEPWQFVVGVGMACAVTALPILILLMERLAILHQPLGQRVLRYASVDDIAIWAVLALIVLAWTHIGRQVAFLLLFAAAAWAFRMIIFADVLLTKQIISGETFTALLLRAVASTTLTAPMVAPRLARMRKPLSPSK